MPNPFDLTMREREVMELVCEGLDNATIGARLGLTSRGARGRLEQAVQKIGVDAINSRVAAAVRFDRAMRSQHKEAIHV